MADDTNPPGCDHNPPFWRHRLPAAGLALCGFLVAGYLALYQWGVFAHIWEPFFGTGSERVLHSWVSRLFPIPDAAVGALVYLAEGIAVVVGGHERWRTFPWAVVLYGAIAAGLGVAAITLLTFRPVFFGTWCTLCLTSAAISLVLAAWAVDGVWAAGRQLWARHAGGADSPQASGG